MVTSGNNIAWRRGSGSRWRPMSEINVTPFVDVMLVLLIVFMVTAPLLAVGVPVDLPRSQARPLPEDSKPLAVTIDAEGRLFLQKTEVGMPELVARLRAIAATSPNLRIYVRGDRHIAYGRVMEVMGLLNAAGFPRVALVTELPGKRRR